MTQDPPASAGSTTYARRLDQNKFLNQLLDTLDHSNAHPKLSDDERMENQTRTLDNLFNHLLVLTLTPYYSDHGKLGAALKSQMLFRHTAEVLHKRKQLDKQTERKR